jgi:hypothetical protein
MGILGSKQQYTLTEPGKQGGLYGKLTSDKAGSAACWVQIAGLTIILFFKSDLESDRVMQQRLFSM